MPEPGRQFGNGQRHPDEHLRTLTEHPDVHDMQGIVVEPLPVVGGGFDGEVPVRLPGSILGCGVAYDLKVFFTVVGKPPARKVRRRLPRGGCSSPRAGAGISG
jgi:hypothetical protein